MRFAHIEWQYAFVVLEHQSTTGRLSHLKNELNVARAPKNGAYSSIQPIYLKRINKMDTEPIEWDYFFTPVQPSTKTMVPFMIFFKPSKKLTA